MFHKVRDWKRLARVFMLWTNWFFCVIVIIIVVSCYHKRHAIIFTLYVMWNALCKTCVCINEYLCICQLALYADLSTVLLTLAITHFITQLSNPSLTHKRDILTITIGFLLADRWISLFSPGAICKIITSIKWALNISSRG